MSIQASWNRMMGSVAGLAAIGKYVSNKPGTTESKFENMSAEELAAVAQKNAKNKAFNQTVDNIGVRLSTKYGLSEDAARQLTDDIRAGRGEGWTSRFDEARLAAIKAREAAQEADERPINNITTAEEALRHLEEIKKQAQAEGGNV